MTMNDGLSIGATQAQAQDRLRSYRTVLAVVLGLYALLGLVALLAPVSLAYALNLPPPFPAAWVRAWGALTLVVVLFTLPGWLDPLRSRWPNLLGIGTRLGLAILYLLLGGGFLWLALLEIVVALLLAWAYFGLFRAELMSRP
jgi:hypothetical protein